MSNKTDENRSKIGSGDLGFYELQSELFRTHVFDAEMQELYLSKRSLHHLKEVRENKERFDMAYADEIAEALKTWAVDSGATHFTHWFQPLTNVSAEKHDSFLCWGPSDTIIEHFRGKELMYAEPDASSFPSGGLRATHEARGYVAWDILNDPFLWENAEGLTLCIPAIFYSWAGDSLDYKIPLFRSDQKIQAAVLRLLELAEVDAKFAFSTLGVEQEYFLVEKHLFDERPDLMFTGRTVFGAKPAKGQELEDHYFGAVKHRVMAFMQEFEAKALSLGIPVKTRHNEVAPSQYEIAPIFEKSSIACDHNLLLMEIMRQVAEKHSLACLLHEKPFAALNGSGKHNNWSIGTDTGLNLLDPKGDPFVFLTMVTAVLRAVHRHSALLRASIGSAGNDHRLGGSEAPPSILSVFLGETLEKYIQDVIHNQKVQSPEEHRIDLGIQWIPIHNADPTDRNRTSFFAFTGNKFEFRAVGASASCAFPIFILNAIVADSLNLILDEIKDHLGDKKINKEKLFEESLVVLRKHLKEAIPVVFNGNNYSEEWHLEAEKRGLPNIRNSLKAFSHLINKQSVRVLENILSEREIESRYEILVEQYAKTMNIETNVMIELFQTKILPSVMNDLKNRFSSLKKGDSVGIQSENQKKAAAQLSRCLDEAILEVNELIDMQQKAADLGWEAKATAFAELVGPKMGICRKKIDALEKLTDRDLWPLPTYQDMLFSI